MYDSFFQLRCLSARLFSALVVVCDVCFTKKGPKSMSNHPANHPINYCFSKAVMYRDDFCEFRITIPSAAITLTVHS